jgi:hypothetical protein
VRRYRRNAEEDLRELERRASTGDPEAVSQFVVAKVRAGRAADVTLGEISVADQSAVNLVMRNVPPRSVSQVVRGALQGSPSGLPEGTPVEAGMVEAFTGFGSDRPSYHRPGEPPRVATPEIVQRMIRLWRRGEINFVDFYLNSWIFMRPLKVTASEWGPVLHLQRVLGWLEEELRSSVYVGVIRVEGAQDQTLNGPWVLPQPWQFELEQSVGA